MVAQGSAGQGTQGQGRGRAREQGSGRRAGQGARAGHCWRPKSSILFTGCTHIQSLPTAAQINTDALAFLFHTEALLQEHTDTRLWAMLGTQRHTHYMTALALLAQKPSSRSTHLQARKAARKILAGIFAKPSINDSQRGSKQGVASCSPQSTRAWHIISFPRIRLWQPGGMSQKASMGWEQRCRKLPLSV